MTRILALAPVSLACALTVSLSAGCTKSSGDAASDAAVAATTAPPPSSPAAPSAAAPSASGSGGAAVAPPPVEILAFGTKGKDRIALLRSGKTLNATYVRTSAGASYRGEMTSDTKFTMRETGAKAGKASTLRGELTADHLNAKMTFDKGQVTSLSLPVFVLPASNGDSDFDFKGTLGGKISVKGTMKRDGAVLAGKYRYKKMQADLALTGSVQPSGVFDLDEAAKPGGAPTGHFHGVFLDKQIAVGEWRSPDGKKSLLFSLEHGDPFAAVEELDGGGKLVPVEVDHSKPDCTNTATVPLLRNLPDAAREIALNAELKTVFGGPAGDPSACEGAKEFGNGIPFDIEASYSVPAKAGRFLALRGGFYSYTGGAHGMSGSACRILDPKLSKLVNPTSLVADKTKFLAWLAGELRKTLDVKDLTEAYFYSNDLPTDPDAMPDMCADGKGKVTVGYQPYVAAPYAAGAPSVEVTTATLRPFLTPGEITSAFF